MDIGLFQGVIVTAVLARAVHRSRGYWTWSKKTNPGISNHAAQMPLDDDTRAARERKEYGADFMSGAITDAMNSAMSWFVIIGTVLSSHWLLLADRVDQPSAGQSRSGDQGIRIPRMGRQTYGN